MQIFLQKREQLETEEVGGWVEWKQEKKEERRVKGGWWSLVFNLGEF